MCFYWLLQLVITTGYYTMSCTYKVRKMELFEETWFMLKFTLPNHWWLQTVVLFFTITLLKLLHLVTTTRYNTLTSTYEVKKKDTTFWGNMLSRSFLSLTTGYYTTWYYWLLLLLMLQSFKQLVTTLWTKHIRLGKRKPFLRKPFLL